MTNTNTQNQKTQAIPHPGSEQDALRAAHVALDAALEKKALAPVLLDVNELCSYTEYILLVSGRSDRQVDAIGQAIQDALQAEGRRPLGLEGRSSGQWTLLDYGDLVIHVFHHPTREHYDLESLWIDAPRMDIDVPEEAQVSPDDRY